MKTTQPGSSSGKTESREASCSRLRSEESVELALESRSTARVIVRRIWSGERALPRFGFEDFLVEEDLLEDGRMVEQEPESLGDLAGREFGRKAALGADLEEVVDRIAVREIIHLSEFHIDGRSRMLGETAECVLPASEIFGITSGARGLSEVDAPRITVRLEYVGSSDVFEEAMEVEVLPKHGEDGKTVIASLEQGWPAVTGVTAGRGHCVRKAPQSWK